MPEIILNLVCRDLPESTPDDRLGTQEKKTVVQDVPFAGVAEIVFTFPITVKGTSGDDMDFGGAFVHGVRGARFLYLCWGHRGAVDEWVGHGRTKITLHTLTWEAAQHAHAEGRALQTVLRLADDKGRVRYASLPAREIMWKIV